MFEVHLVINAPPRVQKNNLQIHKNVTKNGKVRRWIGHSDNFTAYRNKATREMHKQYLTQEGSKLIDFKVTIDFIFYLAEAGDAEADLDNLLGAPLDALIGLKVKGVRGARVCQILKDDRLVKRLTAEKITKEEGYDGKPRTELTIREYQRKKISS
jgi:Holliday junction resolvase RusA-like endonuclease